MRTISWMLVVLLTGAGNACGSGPATNPGGPTAGDPDGDRDRFVPVAGQGAVIVVTNPTRDSWDLALAGTPRGSVAPGSQARLLGVAKGRQVIVASNSRLGLTQTVTVDVGGGQAPEVVLEAMLARLRVDNPHADAVDIAVEGVPIGSARARGETVFEGVPAGRRMLTLKSARGPGAVRIEQVLPARGEAILLVPNLEEAGVTPGAPKPPEGKGLVRMKNASRLAVWVLADGADFGLVAAGGMLDLVLAPGTHKLEVRIEGIEARTEHTVTLLPNQAAEWVWGEDAGTQPAPAP